jgi:hypothetical protein
LLSDQIENRGKILPLLFKVVEAIALPFNLCLTSSDFGSLPGIVPEIRLRSFPLEFFQFRC